MITRRQFATGTTLTAALGLTATACGSDGGDAADGPVELRMTVWTADEKHLALFQEIADEYIADHGDAVSGVTFESIPFEDYDLADHPALWRTLRTSPGSWRAPARSSWSPAPWSRWERP